MLDTYYVRIHPIVIWHMNEGIVQKPRPKVDVTQTFTEEDVRETGIGCAASGGNTGRGTGAGVSSSCAK